MRSRGNLSSKRVASWVRDNWLGSVLKERGTLTWLAAGPYRWFLCHTPAMHWLELAGSWAYRAALLPCTG